jgi:hypothetical protein
MHFHGRKRSKTGVAGFVLSVVCVVSFLVLCIVSAAAKGESGEFIGALGLFVMAGCRVSLYLSLKGLKEKDVYTRVPFAGMVISGILFVLMFCLYVMGIQF